MNVPDVNQKIEAIAEQAGVVGADRFRKPRYQHCRSVEQAAQALAGVKQAILSGNPDPDSKPTEDGMAIVRACSAIAKRGGLSSAVLKAELSGNAVPVLFCDLDRMEDEIRGAVGFLRDYCFDAPTRGLLKQSFNDALYALNRARRADSAQKAGE
jgi:hypothetical protein